MSRRVGEYVVTGKIGEGSFAVVYKGHHKDTLVEVAIKAINREKLNKKLQENLESEISILRNFQHPNIVKLYDIKKTERHIYLILEYCAGGDLQKFIRKKKRLSEPTAQFFLKQLAGGLHFLWSKNLIHRDLKPQNLLLSERSENALLKIADFGFARHLAAASLAETLCGSPLYMAPEILRFHKYDAKADLWSVGTILFEMLTGKPPFTGNNQVHLLANIERNELRIPQDVSVSPDCVNLLQVLLNRNPMLRMSFEEFFSHPFVQVTGDYAGDEDERAARDGFGPSSSTIGPSPLAMGRVSPIKEEANETHSEDVRHYDSREDEWRNLGGSGNHDRNASSDGSRGRDSFKGQSERDSDSSQSRRERGEASSEGQREGESRLQSPAQAQEGQRRVEGGIPRFTREAGRPGRDSADAATAEQGTDRFGTRPRHNSEDSFGAWPSAGERSGQQQHQHQPTGEVGEGEIDSRAGRRDERSEFLKNFQWQSARANESAFGIQPTKKERPRRRSSEIVRQPHHHHPQQLQHNHQHQQHQHQYQNSRHPDSRGGPDGTADGGLAQGRVGGSRRSSDFALHSLSTEAGERGRSSSAAVFAGDGYTKGERVVAEPSEAISGPRHGPREEFSDSGALGAGQLGGPQPQPRSQKESPSPARPDARVSPATDPSRSSSTSTASASPPSGDVDGRAAQRDGGPASASIWGSSGSGGAFSASETGSNTPSPVRARPSLLQESEELYPQRSCDEGRLDLSRHQHHLSSGAVPLHLSPEPKKSSFSSSATSAAAAGHSISSSSSPTSSSSSIATSPAQASVSAKRINPFKSVSTGHHQHQHYAYSAERAKYLGQGGGGGAAGGAEGRAASDRGLADLGGIRLFPKDQSNPSLREGSRDSIEPPWSSSLTPDTGGVPISRAIAATIATSTTGPASVVRRQSATARLGDSRDPEKSGLYADAHRGMQEEPGSERLGVSPQFSGKFPPHLTGGGGGGGGSGGSLDTSDEYVLVDPFASEAGGSPIGSFNAVERDRRSFGGNSNNNNNNNNNTVTNGHLSGIGGSGGTRAEVGRERGSVGGQVCKYREDEKAGPRDLFYKKSSAPAAVGDNAGQGADRARELALKKAVECEKDLQNALFGVEQLAQRGSAVERIALLSFSTAEALEKAWVKGEKRRARAACDKGARAGAAATSKLIKEKERSAQGASTVRKELGISNGLDGGEKSVAVGGEEGLEEGEKDGERDVNSKEGVRDGVKESVKVCVKDGVKEGVEEGQKEGSCAGDKADGEPDKRHALQGRAEQTEKVKVSSSVGPGGESSSAGEEEASTPSGSTRWGSSADEEASAYERPPMGRDPENKEIEKQKVSARTREESARSSKEERIQVSKEQKAQQQREKVEEKAEEVVVTERHSPTRSRERRLAAVQKWAETLVLLLKCMELFQLAIDLSRSALHSSDLASITSLAALSGEDKSTSSPWRDSTAAKDGASDRHSIHSSGGRGSSSSNGGALNSSMGASTLLHRCKNMRKRLSSGLQWLRDHFSPIVDRGEICQLKIQALTAAAAEASTTASAAKGGVEGRLGDSQRNTHGHSTYSEGTSGSLSARSSASNDGAPEGGSSGGGPGEAVDGIFRISQLSGEDPSSGSEGERLSYGERLSFGGQNCASATAAAGAAGGREGEGSARVSDASTSSAHDAPNATAAAAATACPSAESLIYSSALSLANSAALKELLGQRPLALEEYSTALSLMEVLFLHSELSNTDKAVVQRYITNLVARVKRNA